MTIQISKRAKAIKPSPTLTVSALAKQMKSEGIDVINFASAETVRVGEGFIAFALLEI